MITVAEASKIIQDSVHIFPTETVPFGEATGRILRESIHADRDFPPFDRVMMDGICLRFEQLEKGQNKFAIEGRQLAGSPPLELTNPEGCLEIMTGAPLAKGADTVIPFEDFDVEEVDGKKYAVIQIAPSKAFKNVHLQGTDKKTGEALLGNGRKLTSPEIAVVASVGKATIEVTQKPKIAIVSTGDELVDVHEQPLPHQIRRSNSYAIQAALAPLPVESKSFHLTDDKASLKEKLGEIIDNYDAVILSGGVSKGKADFVPEVLEELGVEKLFHRVAQRPGKPFWFGKNADGKVVFALPGNPVSTYMCFYKYFLPWLISSLGLEQPKPLYAILEQDFNFKPDISFFLQVKVVSGEYGQLKAIPFAGKGSGDFANLLQADAFLELPQGRSDFHKGDVLKLVPFREL
ncbi:molybdopterin molybdotransferase MoeA [Flammeovirgaceae bacterium SG7u.111]|nr:molybdopterin molybdotransferase MoeA [Flammeovirgaceae bacterium SG7u.132]WPO34405.1 molybdopterin molybdotransferase MoeA [Flammeovirgaceae bacterium SG7u.111]